MSLIIFLLIITAIIIWFPNIGPRHRHKSESEQSTDKKLKGGARWYFVTHHKGHKRPDIWWGGDK